MPREKSRSKIVDYGKKGDKYDWDQTEEELTLNIRVEDGVRARDLDISIEPTHFRAGIKGSEPIIDGDLGQRVRTDESTWTIEDGVIEVTLTKVKSDWWASAIKGEEEIDLDLIEGAKYLDDGLLQKVKDSKVQKEAST
eukprot:TRINITY_DN1224_c0_g1_i2.p1 TRINITY_DN1224_c0_g1~~TRINITY_DN1224_c0_g1_i2.p1  ORF type:complete len:139 (+),score=38.57 TRINITY_DN1224_c0_g1_i2:181-597(+)